MVESPSNTPHPFTRFYVREREGVGNESRGFLTLEQALAELLLPRWNIRGPCIVERVGTETVTEGGD